MKTFTHRNLPLVLAQAREAVFANFRPILKRVGVTEQQWRILRVLYEENSIESGQLAVRCQMLKPSLTGVLIRMEQLGMIERQRHQSDQRRLVIVMTDEARSKVEKVSAYVNAQYAALEAAYGKEFVKIAFDMLDRLIHGAVNVNPVKLPPASLSLRNSTRRQRGSA